MYYFVLRSFRNFNLIRDFVIIIDTYRRMFSFTVSIICCRVLNFSKRYLMREKFKIRFFVILFLFVLSIFVLIFSGRFFFLILGWDGLGVVSYLLVIYFFSRKSNNAGMLTILSNRFGDILLILRISIVIVLGWNWQLWSNLSLKRELCWIIILGCFTKRAQIPFSAWLPAAIAAPTPVSSLVHSSTLVTAGIYVIFRFRGVLSFYGVEIFGMLTILIAGLNALKEIDIKKIVALSTLSQLGLIVCGLGIEFYRIRFFHLILHAFFKAILFIRVGNIIHLSDDFQDFRKINFFEDVSSVTLTFCLIANFSLMGFPFLRGFVSKDLLLEYFFLNHYFTRFYWGGFWLGCVITGVYRLRFLRKLIFGVYLRKTQIFKFNEDWNFILGGRVLWGLSVFGGRRLFWVIQDFQEIMFFSRRFKNLIIFILLVGILIWVRIFYGRKFARIKNWHLFFIWRLPLFSNRLLKNFMFKTYWRVAFFRDQFLNKDLLIFGRNSYGGAKNFIFKKFFPVWKILFLLFLIVII